MAKTYQIVQATNYPNVGESVLANNFSATTAPAVGNDVSQGYGPGSLWIDVTHSNIYQCATAAVGAASWLQLGGTVGTPSGVLYLGNAAASTANAVLLTTETATLAASTKKGGVYIHASDGTFGLFHLPIGSTTPVLVIGSSGSVMASPTAGYWGISYSGGNWKISNQTTGTLSFWLGAFMGG